MQNRVLIAGESWITHSIHQKGFDSFTTTAYEEGVEPLQTALEAGGIAVDFLPNHVAGTKFPTNIEELRQYDSVVLSDIGANTLLLHPDTFARSERKPNRLTLLNEYVRSGGGLVMIGGYLTFQGIDGRGCYKGTAVEEILPVQLQIGDDRVEMPEGAYPQILVPDHPIVTGLSAEWPYILGANRVEPKQGAALIAEVNDLPLLVAWEYEQGRTVAFTSDCAPHWCPPEFISWDGYTRLWQQLVGWLAGEK